MKKPRELKIKEIETNFLNMIKSTIEEVEKYKDKSEREKLELLAFSILVNIDGEGGNLPAWILAPDPHKDDKEYNKKNGNNWYPENYKSKVNGDISGSLHNGFHILILSALDVTTPRGGKDEFEDI